MVVLFVASPEASKLVFHSVYTINILTSSEQKSSLASSLTAFAILCFLGLNPPKVRWTIKGVKNKTVGNNDTTIPNLGRLGIHM